MFLGWRQNIRILDLKFCGNGKKDFDPVCILLCQTCTEGKLQEGWEDAAGFASSGPDEAFWANWKARVVPSMN